MPNQWFRLYSDFRSDPKVRTMPEVMQLRLVRLMCLRCDGPTELLSEEEIAYGLGIDHETFQKRLHETQGTFHETKALFQSKGFIDDKWSLLKWEKRQFASDNSTERVRKYRNKKKMNQELGNDQDSVSRNVSRNVSVTEVKRPRTESFSTLSSSLRSEDEGLNPLPSLSRVAGPQSALMQTNGEDAQNGSQRPLASENGPTPHANHSEGGNGHRKKIAPGVKNGLDTAKSSAATDSRHAVFRAEIQAWWTAVNPQLGRCPWDGSEGKKLDAFLKASPDFTLPMLQTCLKNRSLSAEAQAFSWTDRPRLWVESLTSFLEGPIDRYGKPLPAPRRL